MNGVERIAAERERQVEEEGWTPEHDDSHRRGELARAAACYAAPVLVYHAQVRAPTGHRGHDYKFVEFWPWDAEWDKRSDRSVNTWIRQDELAEIDARIQDLKKAGALCAAEIDRLLRHRAEMEATRGSE